VPANNEEPEGSPGKKKLPIGRILAVLDERGIPYSPRASRSDLEDLLADGGLRDSNNSSSNNSNNVVAVKEAEEDIEVVEVEYISPEEWKLQQEQKYRQKQREQEEAKQQKKQQKQRQQQQQPSNSDGETPNRPGPTAGAAASGGGSFRRRSVHGYYRGFSATAARAYHGQGGRSSPRRRRGRPTRTARSAPGTVAAKPPPPRTPDPGASAEETERERRPPGRGPGPGGDRKIYSPFGKQQQQRSDEPSPRPGRTPARRREKDTAAATTTTTTARARTERGTRNTDLGEEDIEDDLDRLGGVVEDDLGRFGDFLAESVDNLFWGAAGDETTPSRRRGSRHENRGQAETANGPPDDESGRRRHWKDRAEERVDKILGIHGTGGGDRSYDRWSEKEFRDAEENGGGAYDAFSYARGRRRPRTKKKKRAFWEEDGSVLSVLLGHNWDDSRHPQRSLRTHLDDVKGALGSGSSLSALLGNLFLVSARIAGSVFRWASVRETIPLPVVALSAMGAGLVSPPGAGFKNTLLTLLSLRVFGEWLGDDRGSGDHRYGGVGEGERRRGRSRRREGGYENGDYENDDYDDDDDDYVGGGEGKRIPTDRR